MFGQTRFPDKVVVGSQTAVNQRRLVSRKTRDKINFWIGGEINFWTCDKIKPLDWRETGEKRESDVGLLLGFVYVTIISITCPL